MILGHGIDIVEFSRIEKLFKKFGRKFEEKILNEQEILQLKNLKIEKKISAIASCFSTKEALSKALEQGIGGEISFHNITKINSENGAPQIIVSKKLDNFIKKKFGVKKYKINLSISNTNELTIASVVIS